MQHRTSAADAMRAPMHTPVSPTARDEYDRALATARAALGDAAFAAASEAGRTLPLDIIVAQVTETPLAPTRRDARPSCSGLPP